MNRILLAAIAGLFAAAPAVAQSVGLNGRVTDRTTGAPVPHATVVAGDRMQDTDAQGIFSFGALGAGPVKVIVRAIGYGPDSLWLDLIPGLDQGLAIELEPAPVLLDSITVAVVSAGLTLTGAELARRGHDLGRALNGWSGLVVRHSGSGGPATPQYRGGAPDELLVLIDGFPANDPLTGRADLSGLTSRDVARVTLLPGSQTARGGARAVTGILSIQTRIRFSPEVSASIEGDGANTVRLAGSLAKLSASLRREEFADGFGYDIPTVRGGGEGTRQNAGGSRWSLVARYTGPVALSARATASERGVPGIVTNPTSSAGASDRSVFVGARIPGVVELQGSFEYLRTRVADPSPPGRPPYDATTEGVSLSAGAGVSNPVDLIDWAGTMNTALDLRHDRFHGDGIAGDARFNRAGLSWQATLSRDGDGSISLAPVVRLDWWTGRDRPAASARLDLAWSLGGGTTLTLGGGNGVTPPVLSDLFFREGVGVRVNPDLQPERVRWEVEAGAAHRGAFRGIPFEASARAFYGRVDNMIIWSPDFRFVWSPRNFDVKRKGTEATLRIEPSPELEFGFSGSWSAVTHVPSGTQAQYRPQVATSARLAWSPGAWRADARWHRVGTRYPNAA
ncbi:MAG: TonB-dependent receptor, partial [Gemmatimonadales bacterium]